MLWLPRKSAAGPAQRQGALIGSSNKPASGGGGGGSNNVAIVSGHLGGSTATGLANTYAFDSSHQVTSGNVVLVGVTTYTGTFTWATSQLTKTAGTATIGTVALDQSIAPATNQVGLAIYRVPITGSGTLTLQWTQVALAPDFVILACAEFSGLNAAPLGTTSTATGTGVTESTGSITVATGLEWYVASELGTNPWTRTESDILVFSETDNAHVTTGVIQYKIVNSTPITMTSSTDASGTAWKVAYANYKTS